jgi:hypothetical protein
MERLSAPERTREELRALMNGDLGTAAGRGDLVRLALRLIVEEALESEVSDDLGRERYERGEGEKAGYRNGYRPGKVKTAEGAVEYSALQVRDTPEPFISNVRAALSPHAIRRHRGRSRANWRPASALTTATSCRARSPVSRTISRRESRTCGCRSRTAVSFGPQTSSNGCSSRSVEG